MIRTPFSDFISVEISNMSLEDLSDTIDYILMSIRKHLYTISPTLTL